jgi:hypothetical protein
MLARRTPTRESVLYVNAIAVLLGTPVPSGLGGHVKCHKLELGSLELGGTVRHARALNSREFLQ